MALEVINRLPKFDIKIYIDGSKIEDMAGSGICNETPQHKISLFQCNRKYYAVFRSECLTIEVELEMVSRQNNFGDIWILMDNRSVLQHLKNWLNIGDQISTFIYNKLNSISLQHEIHLHWVPSHVNIHGNEMADNLAKRGCSQLTLNSIKPALIVFFLLKNQLIILICDSLQQWYLRYNGGRCFHTYLSRFNSSHLKSLKFSEEERFFAPMS